LLDLRRRNPHLNTPRADGKSRFQRNLNSTYCAQASNYYKTTKFRDNSYCGWFYSLIFVDVVMLVGWIIG
jgi:hypothetical protein